MISCLLSMCSSSAGPCSKPCLSNSIPPGATLPAGFFSPWWGSSPAGAFCCHAPPSGPLCVSPPWRLCTAFSFSGCNFTRLYFSFVLWLSCGVVRRLRLACVGVWRFPWPSVGRSRGGWACISGRRCSRLGASGAAVGGPGPGMAGGGPGVFGVGRPIFCGGLPDRSARASGGASACAKVAEAKSRPRQPFSRSAGLNYSRSSSADNSAIFLRIDSFFCAATKSKVDEAYSPFSPSTIVAPLPLTSSRYFFRRSSAEAASPRALFGVRTTSCWSLMP